jgi:hypothetical protein
MFVEVLGDIRHVEVRVALIRELLELGVEGFLTIVGIERRCWQSDAVAYPSKANLVTKVVETPNAIFCVFEIVVLDEPEAVMRVSKMTVR